MKPEQLGIARLKRDVIKLKAERDIPKKAGLHQIKRLMRLQALKARPRQRRLPLDLGERQIAAVAANVLDRTFALSTEPGAEHIHALPF